VVRWRLSIALAVGVVCPFVLASPVGAAGTATYTGAIDGAPYQIDVPQPWNGTLVLWSHGYEAPAPGPRQTPADAPDPASKQWLLSHGYALAGSGYSKQGYAIQEALHDQTALLDHFDTLPFGHPRRTIAWGGSLGGIITAGLLQREPWRFSGAIPLCGVLAGSVGVWNQSLDAEFAFKTLLAPDSPLRVVDITNPGLNYSLAIQTLTAAQATPQGRARLALAAAMGDVPGWYTPGSPEPAPTDYPAQEANQFLWDQNPDFAFAFYLRQELEARAGGNPSWNTGVDYRRQLGRSAGRDEVKALYRAAGLDLDADLRTLAQAPRIEADPAAVAYLARNITFDGRIARPVLTEHTTGDGLVVDENEQAYAQVVRSAGRSSLLRQTFVHRAGHCSFTSAELLAGFTTMVRRLDTGRWGDSTEPRRMNTTAASFGGPSAFVDYRPGPFLRPFQGRRDS
jgi:Prolyl oligopeptidase family